MLKDFERIAQETNMNVSNGKNDVNEEAYNEMIKKWDDELKASNQRSDEFCKKNEILIEDNSK